jgi:cobalt-zinc-cadmium efflux system outer membrane protein
MRRLLLAVLVGLFAPRAAGAMTLEEALALAEQAPAAQAARARAQAADAAAEASGAWPATTVGAATTTSSAHAILTASVPVPIFGTLGASRAVGRAEADTAAAERRVAWLDLRQRVTRAWLELARLEARSERAGAGAEREAELAAATRRRFDAGDTARVDVVASEAQAARARARAEGERENALAAAALLAGALGLDPETPLHADGGLPAPGDGAPLERRAERTAAHPEVRAAAGRVAAEAGRADAARAERWPHLALDVEGTIDDPTLPGNDLRLGVTLELPLLGKTGDAVRAAEARQRAAELERAVAAHQVGAELVAAHRAWGSARRRALNLETTVVPAQREAARLARVAYEQGQLGLISALEAERTLVDVEVEAIDARAEAAAAHADLARAEGEAP